MAIQITSLDQLSDEQVATAHETLKQLISEANPNAQQKRGVIHDIVLHLNAVLAAKNRAEVDLVRRSQSLKLIAESPELADDAVVDAALSNYGITRKSGSKATGQVLIVLSAQTPVTIASGARFTADGRVYTATTAFSARLTAGEVTSSNDRVLTALGDGEYGFLVDVVASEEGPSYRLRRDAKVVPDIAPRSFVRAYAASEFTGGALTETNTELIARQQLGIAAKCWSNRATIWAMIKAQADFESCVAISIIGGGDEEMVRDQHSLLPISFFGRCDVYARTRDLPITTELTLSATLVDTTAAGGIWQFSVDAASAPGFYDITKIVPADDVNMEGTFGVSQLIRSYDLGDAPWKPDVEAASEAVYSPFQTAIIQFLDTSTATTGLAVNEATKDYVVVLRHMPQLRELQDFLSDRSIRDPSGDVLVRAAIPCDLTVNFTIRLRTDDELPDENAIKADLSQLVNGLGFPGQLEASRLIDVIHGHLSGRAAISRVDMFGRIKAPIGNPLYVRDRENIEIPHRPELGVTARTVTFFLDPAEIGISIETVAAPDRL